MRSLVKRESSRSARRRAAVPPARRSTPPPPHQLPTPTNPRTFSTQLQSPNLCRAHTPLLASPTRRREIHPLPTAHLESSSPLARGKEKQLLHTCRGLHTRARADAALKPIVSIAQSLRLHLNPLLLAVVGTEEAPSAAAEKKKSLPYRPAAERSAVPNAAAAADSFRPRAKPWATEPHQYLVLWRSYSSSSSSSSRNERSSAGAGER